MLGGVEELLLGAFLAGEQVVLLFEPLLASGVDGGEDLLLDLEEGTSLASKKHFLEDGLDQFTEQRWIQSG